MWSNPVLFQYLWDGLMVGVCLVDHEGAITHMNVPGSRLLGWGAVGPDNISIEEVFGGSELDGKELVNSQLLLDRLKENKIVWLPRARLRCRQGTWCWVELKAVAIEGGDATQFLLMFRDLSSETQLAEDYSRLASIPEESPFPIIEVDAAGHLLYANPSMVRLMEDAHIGQDGFTTALPDQFPDLAARCFAQGHLESNIEVEVGEKHYAWSFSSHPELGRLRGYGMDVTDSKRASVELSEFAETLETKNQELDQALLKAEAATLAKAAFLATMSHEIRTPLNGVIGMAELLLNSTLNVEQQECTKIIRNSGEGLLAIINDILDFSKIESGHMALESIGFNPLVLVEEVLDLFSQRAAHKGLDLAAYVEPDIPRHLFGDPHRLRQILCNFISNALKFTNHGSVLMEVEWLPVDREKMSDGASDGTTVSEPISEDSIGCVRFSVKDTGIGISEPAQQKIFQVFMQADSSMSRKFGGSGLGLAICKQLAELMNGRVGVESQVGEGTTFWCDLPFRLPVLEKSILVEDRIGVKKDMLVYSSLNVSIEVLSHYLNDRGVRAVRVDGVQEAMAFIENKRACPSDVLGIIMGREIKHEEWEAWLRGLRASSFSKLKLFSLTPFWLRKGNNDFPVTFDGMITMPIHRDQLYRCVFDEPDVSGMPVNSNEGEPQEKKECATEGDHEGKGSIEENTTEQERLSPSVLIVEDNPVNQKVAAGLFEKLGCHVHIAESGNQALLLVQEYDLDLIVMDWGLPGMDGFETAHAIRELEKTKRLERRRPLSKTRYQSGFMPCSHIPIVGMTAHRLSEQDRHRWIGVMDDCLSKPIHFRELANVLERWVGFRVQARGHQCTSSDGRLQANPTGVGIVDRPHVVRTPVDDLQSYERYDLPGSIEAMEGDELLLHSLFKIFLETKANLIHGMKEGIAKEDRPHFQRKAHQLKGALYALNATHQAKIVEQLETTALVCPFSQLENLLKEAEKEVEGLISVFRDALRSSEGGGVHKSEAIIIEG
jgi:PAS domain S-box-containing protein